MAQVFVTLAQLVAGLRLCLRGDSRFYGVGATEFATTFAHYLELEVPCIWDNDSTPGITLQEFLNSRTPVYQAGVHGALCFGLATNNIRMGQPVAIFIAAYRAKLLDALEKGWPIERIIIPTPGWFNAYGNGSEALALSYNAALLALAQELGAIFLDLWNPLANLADRESYFKAEDGYFPYFLHEGDKGQRFLADTFKAANYAREQVTQPVLRSWRPTLRFAA